MKEKSDAGLNYCFCSQCPESKIPSFFSNGAGDISVGFPSVFNSLSVTDFTAGNSSVAYGH